MIPFWKKTGKHSKPQSAQKRRQNAKPAVPWTAQQSIPMQRMFEDGTCRVKPNYYTRTIQYQDINYQLAQQEDKTAIFEEWCSFLNFFDSSIKFELSFVNMATDSTEFEKSIRIPYQRDGFDDVRAEYSQMLRQQLAKGNNGLTKTKFITFGVEGESMAQVKPRLDHIQNDLLNNFHRLGVQAKSLNGVQRLKLMHDMFNMDGASKFHFDWKDLVKSGLSVKDQIVLRGELSYPVPLGDDPRGNIVRLDNAIGNFADRIADADAALDSLEQQKQAAEVEIAKPFAQEEELQTKSARLAELDALLNMEHQSSRTEPEAEEKPDARPSVLAALEEKADKVEPVRPFKSYLDKDGDAR